jgi:tetratricopeptide (TPR) repeat protein
MLTIYLLRRAIIVPRMRAASRISGRAISSKSIAPGVAEGSCDFGKTRLLAYGAARASLLNRPGLNPGNNMLVNRKVSIGAHDPRTFEPEVVADPTRHRNFCEMTARSFLGSIPRIAWALPKHWTWTPEHLAEQIASRADACRVSSVWKVDAGTDFEERWRLRRWRRIARYCLELTPDNGDAWIVLGHAECRSAYSVPRHRRRFEAAKRAYQVAAKLKRDSRTWISLGEVGTYSGDLEIQFSAFKTVLEIDPSNAWAQWSLGEAHAKAGEHLEAVRLFRQSIQQMGEDKFGAVVYVDLALSDLRLGNVEEAIESLLKAVCLDRGAYCETQYPQIAESFYGHDQSAAELRDRLSAINPSLAAKFYAYFQPRVGTVTYAKGYCRIETSSVGPNHGDYFILVKEIEAAGFPKLRVGDRVEFHSGIGRRVLADYLKLLPRAE